MLKFYTLLVLLLAFTQLNAQTLVINPALRYQEMVGFGGALTWHCDRITKSSKKNEITNILFEDLGIDILRLKNWYYPINYPDNKTATTMEVDWFKYHFDATNKLFAIAKTKNPDIEVLFSCWGPPSSLKSNNVLNEGTLAKNDTIFRYGDYAQFWVDILDHITFKPDYISIQNEPGYENPGWASCGWRPEETADYPAYFIGVDSVYNRISNRESVPKFISPEVENIGSAIWDNNLNTFESMASTVRENPNVYAYAYHLYNFYSTPNSVNTSLLNTIKNDYGNKPAFMTEFSSNSYGWLETANMIQLNLIEANVSAYIYWELMWNQDSKNAMLQVDDNGNYTVLPNYYAIKHFAKFIDKGYTRVDVSGGNTTLKATGFIDPLGEQLTVVVTNTSASSKLITIDYGDFVVNSTLGYQSTEGNYYKLLTGITANQTQFDLPKKSITTLVFSQLELVSAESIEAFTAKSLNIFPNPAHNFVNLSKVQKWTLFNSLGKMISNGESTYIDLSGVPAGLYYISADGKVGKLVKE